MRRRYDEAIAQLRKTLEMDPGYLLCPCQPGPGYSRRSERFGEAISEYQKARALNDDPIRARAARSRSMPPRVTRTEALKITGPAERGIQAALRLHV